jgi:hypothetical protein
MFRGASFQANQSVWLRIAAMNCRSGENIRLLVFVRLHMSPIVSHAPPGNSVRETDVRSRQCSVACCATLRRQSDIAQARGCDTHSCGVGLKLRLAIKAPALQFS